MDQNLYGFLAQRNIQLLEEYTEFKGFSLMTLCGKPTDVNKNQIMVSKSIMDKFGYNNGDYVLVTPDLNKYEPFFVISMRIYEYPEGLTDVSGFPVANEGDGNCAVISSELLKKLQYETYDMVKQLNPLILSVLSIKDDKVGEAESILSANKLFAGSKSNVDGPVLQGGWVRMRPQLEQEIPSDINIPMGTSNYSMVTYKCPECGKNIAKILVNPTRIVGEDGIDHTVEVMFTCSNCQSLFAPLTRRLAEGFDYIRLDEETYSKATRLLDNSARG